MVVDELTNDHLAQPAVRKLGGESLVRLAGHRCPALAEVERETAEWVRWYNHERIHSSIGYRTPIEHKYATNVARRGEVGAR